MCLLATFPGNIPDFGNKAVGKQTCFPCRHCMKYAWPAPGERPILLESFQVGTTSTKCSQEVLTHCLQRSVLKENRTPAWCIDWVSGQPQLPGETLSPKTKIKYKIKVLARYLGIHTQSNRHMKLAVTYFLHWCQILWYLEELCFVFWQKK